MGNSSVLASAGFAGCHPFISRTSTDTSVSVIFIQHGGLTACLRMKLIGASDAARRDSASVRARARARASVCVPCVPFFSMCRAVAPSFPPPPRPEFILRQQPMTDILLRSQSDGALLLRIGQPPCDEKNKQLVNGIYDMFVDLIFWKNKKLLNTFK